MLCLCEDSERRNDTNTQTHWKKHTQTLERAGGSSNVSKELHTHSSSIEKLSGSVSGKKNQINTSFFNLTRHDRENSSLLRSKEEFNLP